MKNLLDKEYLPTTALVVYEAPGNDHIAGQEKEYYLETHSIQPHEGGKFCLGEGSPVTYEGIAAIARGLQKQAEAASQLTGIFPENLLYSSPTPGVVHLVWYDKPAMRRWLGNGVEVEAMAPAMLYNMHGRTLQVFAMDCEGYPEPDTRLLHTGWSNISGGLVCMGNTQFKRHSPTYRQMVEEWTSAFWHSQFTGLTSDHADYLLLRRIAKDKSPYPTKGLKKYSTFAQFAAKL